MAGNWSAGVPDSLTDATINNGGTAQLASGTAAAGSLTIGGAGPGTLQWTGGTLDTWDITVGAGGTLDRSGLADHWAYGGRLQVDSGQVLMPAATYEIRLNEGAEMNLTGTGSVSNFHAVIVGAAGDTNTMQTVSLADSAQMTGLNYIIVGKDGHKGQVLQSGGTVGTTHLFLGEFGAAEGNYVLSSGAVNVGNDIMVGKENIGTFTQTGGEVHSGLVNIAGAGGSSGTYELQGGLLETPVLGMGAGAGAFNLTGGTLRANFVGFGLTNGGTLDVGSIPGRIVRIWYEGNDPTDTAPPENWNITDTLPWDVDSDTDTVWGGGDQPLRGYPGGTADYYSVVYAGQVYVPAAGNIAFREEIDDSTVLYVDGVRRLWDYTAASDMGEPAGNPWTVHATTTIPLGEGWHDLEIRLGDHWGGQGGVLQWDPAGGTNWQAISGSSLRTPAQTVIMGDYTQTAAGTLAIDIDAAGDANDKLVVEGTLNAGGTLQVSLLSGEPEPGSVFDVLDFNQVGSEFDTLDLPAFSRPGIRWDTSMLYVTGELSVTVPEPATWALFGVGALLVCLGIRKRRR